MRLNEKSIFQRRLSLKFAQDAGMLGLHRAAGRAVKRADAFMAICNTITIYNVSNDS